MTGGKLVRLTDAGVARLKPGETEYLIRDSRVAGLAVRVRSSGHRSFVWHGQANGRAVRKTIGSAVLMTVEQARRQCVALQNGDRPAGAGNAKDRPGVPLFREFVVGEWSAASRSRMGASWRKYVDRMLERQLLPAFGTLRLDRIGRREIERWFDAYSETSPGAANHALRLLRQILNAAVAAGLIENSPARGIKRNPRPKFTRFLSTGEIDRLHRTLDRLVEQQPSRRRQADIIRLLLLTGCRRGEIVKLKWSEFDGDVLRLTRTKTGPRTVWLSGAARAILDRQPRTGSPYVFPSPLDPARPSYREVQFWYRARKEAGIEDVRLHDLRHTVASQAVARGAALPTVAKMLGHADPRMTLRYAHASDRDVEAAAERIGTAIAYAMKTGRTIDERYPGIFMTVG